jgi:hypothetical protein
MYLNTFVGTINDFFQPLDGGAGFGGSSLVLVAAIVPLLSLLRVRVPAVISIVWVLLLLLFLSIQGDRTPVHYVLWKIMPFSSGMRVPQRMSMIMPVFFMLILVWLLKPGGKPVGSLKAWGMGIQPNAPMVVGLAGTLCTLIYAFLPGRLVTNPFEFSTRITQAIQPGILTLYLPPPHPTSGRSWTRRGSPPTTSTSPARAHPRRACSGRLNRHTLNPSWA